METKNYRLAKSYCFKLDPNTYQDILHDAYLHWFKYKGTNLFDEDNKLIIFVLKRVFYTRLKKDKLYYKEGEYYTRQFQEVEEHHSILNTNVENELTTETRLVELVKKLTSREKDILHYKLLGYNGEEIAELLQVKPVLISYSLSQIKKKYLQISIID